MDKNSPSENLMLWTASGAFSGLTVGVYESVWKYPTLAAHQMPSFKSQIRHIGGRTFLLAAVGAAFAIGEIASEKIRHKDDFLNPAVGGFLAGSVFGVNARSLPVSMKAGAAVAAGAGYISFMSTGFETPYERWVAERPELRRQE